MTNKDVLIMGAYRFLRVAVALVLSVVVPSTIEVLSGLTVSPEYHLLIVGILIPTLTSADKMAREKGYY